MSADAATADAAAVAVAAVTRDAGAVLTARRRAGRYQVLTVRAPGIVAHARPGQFVSIAVGAPLALLRRPFAIAGVDPAAGTFDVVMAVVGEGSAWLAERAAPSTLDVVGALGQGFALPSAPSRCLLVGGGYGTAALEWLALALRGGGHDVALLSGAAGADALYPVTRLAGDVAVDESTDDGSRGRRGLVTAALRAWLDRWPDAKVFACGPMAMLAAVARMTAAAGNDCQVAVEEHMGCSVGVCMTCVVPSAEGGYLRACIDGPVLDAQRVDWAAVGRPPSGASGHPSVAVLDRQPPGDRHSGAR